MFLPKAWSPASFGRRLTAKRSRRTSPWRARLAMRRQVRAANKAAVEAIAVGQRVLVGQYWTDSAFKRAYDAALS